MGQSQCARNDELLQSPCSQGTTLYNEPLSQIPWQKKYLKKFVLARLIVSVLFYIEVEHFTNQQSKQLHLNSSRPTFMLNLILCRPLILYYVKHPKFIDMRILLNFQTFRILIFTFFLRNIELQQLFVIFHTHSNKYPTGFSVYILVVLVWI